MANASQMSAPLKGIPQSQTRIELLSTASGEESRFRPTLQSNDF